MRLATGVALLVTALALLIAAGGGQAAKTPANAEVWLGTWDTNFGTVYFRDVYRVKNDYPELNGKYGWVAEGTWDRKGGNPTHISGGITGDGLRTFAGCWRPPPTPDSSRCGQILIHRTGKKISGGYWKACGLGTNCANHHPWKGKREEGAWKVGFRFTQKGFPDGHRGIPTQTGGAGAIVLQHEPGVGDSVGVATHESRVFHVEHVPDVGDINVTVGLGGGRLDPGDRRTSLVLTGVVTKTDYAGCTKDSIVSFFLRDGHGGVPDQIHMRPKSETCDIDLTWTSKDKQRVNVHIDKARETG